MTAGVVWPIIPQTGPEAGRWSGSGVVRRPLPLPPVPLTSDAGSVVFGVTAVDVSGRVAEATVLGALGWGVGTRLGIRVESGLVLVAADPGAVFRMRRAGQFRLPAGVRDWCGLGAGSRVLLVADLAAGLLVVHPPVVVAAMVGRVHVAVLSGEAR